MGDHECRWRWIVGWEGFVVRSFFSSLVLISVDDLSFPDSRGKCGV